VGCRQKSVPVGYSVDLMTLLQDLLSSREVSSDKKESAEIK